MWEDCTKTVAEGIMEDRHEDSRKDCCSASYDRQDGNNTLAMNMFLLAPKYAMIDDIFYKLGLVNNKKALVSVINTQIFIGTHLDIHLSINFLYSQNSSN